ncbi:MAG TPA: hypothetical protein VFK80_05365, partial [Limnochordia bacterium]|nr:hypothetical protein [Limnochordia bacterium]
MRTLETRYEFPTYTTRAEWEARRRQLRAHLQVVLGLDPAWPAPPFDARYGELRSYEDFTVQPVWLQTLPGFYVGGNLFRPRGDASPHAAVLNPHGHAKNGRFHQGEDLATLRRCATLAKLGYVAYAWDMLAYGDTYQLPHIFESARAKLWGLTPLGVHVHNARRAFAFLASLPDVDPARIACTGESGGAGQTFFLAALEPRLAAAAPVCMISAHYQGGCRCEHAPGLRTDTYNVEIAAMFAPKPMLVVSTAGDWTCNTPEVELPDIRRIYALYGAEDQLEGFHGPWPHNYNAPSRQAVYAWLRRVLPVESAADAAAEPPAGAAAAKPAGPPAPVAEPELSADEVASWRAERALLPAGLRTGDDLLAELIACRRTAASGEREETRRRLRHVLGLWRLSRPDVGGGEPATDRVAAVERVLL